MTYRTSRIAYVLVRLLVGEKDCFLLRVHRKWGDWGLVGGHVEDDELDDWRRAAEREANEELEPLRLGVDFSLEPLDNAPESWGPVPSRSTAGVPTKYCAAWFTLQFLRDPVECLSELPDEEFLLVERDAALIAAGGDVTALLARLERELPEGLSSVPLAWPYQLDRAAVASKIRFTRPSARAQSTSAELSK
jgi:8-oxo-dGTP pyrophosphatase MutT (NUDIX family)